MGLRQMETLFFWYPVSMEERFDKEVVEKVKADIVIYELRERSILSLLDFIYSTGMPATVGSR